ncbi:hypothetical protein B0F90DRAFT_1809704 [Multifurca ochricompacta]|uniref:Senescence domain-containing protein n=1 Tax=Multifurca ochricompacta TaxID=376703 RepID=A0AAD4M6P2_9AGAM|nr:hypothetical protein B0F90DRAFT_1809704 [Multifurca ochricompacta]
MSAIPEAYILVAIPNATFTSSSTGTHTSQLALEYVTFSIPEVTVTRDVLLILRLLDNGTFEAPLDPARTITESVLPSGARRYIFHATRDDSEFTVEIPLTPENAEDVELFHSVLLGYAADFRGDSRAVSPAVGLDHDSGIPIEEEVRPEEDLRGRFVLMNEDNREIVSALDQSVKVFEDPSLEEKGHENDPVVVELPEGTDTVEDLQDIEVLVRTVAREDRDWMMKGAVFVSHVISGTTTLLTSAMTSASNYYIAHSTPSPHATGTTSPTPGTGPSTPPAAAPPSRTLLLLQSSATRKHLTRIHAVSGGAVKLSNKTAAAVESLIQRAVGTDKGKGRAPPLTVPTPQLASLISQSPPTSSITKPPLPPRSRGPSPTPPPAYSLDKPPLPPRHDKSPSSSRAPSPLLQSKLPITTTTIPSHPLSTRTRVALSAALILASLSASSVRLVDTGGAAVTAAVSHKYGTVAGDNAALAARTVRNIVLIYVDVRGLGRRVIVKRTAKTWIKGHIRRGKEGAASG